MGLLTPGNAHGLLLAHAWLVHISSLSNPITVLDQFFEIV